MKVEMAESLIRSWVRHICQYQVAELNWKPSPVWEKTQDVDCAVVFERAKTFFYDKFRTEIFKGTSSAEQLMKQSEIDVLGVRIEGGIASEVIAVDVAFHTGGLLYGNKEVTAARVAKKILRSAMILKLYFPDVTPKVLFASPKINPTNLDLLSKTFDALDEYFQLIKWPIECKLICNGDFESKILEPTLNLGSEVADTSELFLRSYQLLSMFPKKEKKRVIVRPDKPSTPSINDPIPPSPVSGGGDRPIHLIPSPASTFKQAFLERGVATITINYLNGRVENKKWSKNRFNIESNLMGNLRSRTEFRPDAWERNNIRDVIVTVDGYGT